MSKRNESRHASARVPADGSAPPQAQVEAAVVRVLEAVAPALLPRQSNGGALKRAEEIGRAHKEKPAT